MQVSVTIESNLRAETPENAEATDVQEDEVEVQEEMISSSDKPVTPLPKGAITAIMMVFICEGFAYSFLFPFVGFMILDFGLVADEKEAGYYAGLLAGSFAIAEIFGSIVCGILADKISKRYVVMGCCVGCTISMVAFGFSPNYVYAILVRAINGAFNGNATLTKAYLTEVTDSTNQARAFSLITVAWGVGAVGGPVLGGFLARPATKYALFANVQLFIKFPYMLPCLFAAVLMVVTFFCTTIFMKDPKQIGQPSVPAQAVEPNFEMSEVSVEGDSPIESSSNSIEEDLQVEQQDQTNELEKLALHSKAWYMIKKEVKEIFSLIFTYEILLINFVFFIVIVLEVYQDELLPLWAMIDQKDGGLSFDTSQIGIIQAILGGLYLVMPAVYEPISWRMGHLNTMRAGFILMVVLLFTPQMSFLAGVSKGLFWTGAAVYGIVRAFTGTLTYTAIVVVLSNACRPGTAGRVQAFSSSFTGLSRFVAPLVAGPLFALSTSLSSKHSKLFINLPFLVFICLSLLALLFSFGLNKSLNIPKAEALAKQETPVSDV